VNYADDKTDPDRPRSHGGRRQKENQKMHDPKKRLIELLSVLIAWKSGSSDEYVGPVCGPAQEQHEVARLLDEYPALANASAIRAALERAHRAVIETVTTPPERYTLAELLVPPLTAFGAAGATDLYPVELGDWDNIEEDLNLELEEWLGDLGTPRLGTVVDAWVREVDSDVFEIIEMWVVWFVGRKQKHHHHEAECWYRYRSDRRDEGLVYATERAAFRGREGGLPLSMALSDGLLHGLVLGIDPEDDSHSKNP
jgi:hypothetical protein